MGIERADTIQENPDGSVWTLSCSYVYNDVTGQIESVEWDNGFPFDLAITISAPGRPDVSTTLRAGRSGRRQNVPDGYTHQGTTYQVGRA